MVTLPEAKLFIDGELRAAASGKTYDVINPWTGEVVGKAADGGREDVEAAIVAARRAFDTTDWSTNKDKRVELVKKLRALFEANRERLSDLARFEAGAAIGAVAMAHVGNALGSWDDYLTVIASSCMNRSASSARSRRGTCRSTSTSARSSPRCSPAAR